MEWLIFLLILFNLSTTSLAGDMITVGTSLSDGQTLISASENFQLGFFAPDNSQNRYLGIWYKKIPQTVIWLANRGSPIINSTGTLKIGNDGDLILQNSEGNVFWSTLPSYRTRLVAKLLDSGNFILKDISDDSESTVWQSFDYPCDTLLPGMKLGWSRKTNLNRYITTWKSKNDPSLGDYSFKMDLQGHPELFMKDLSQKIYRSGPWIGYEFSGEPEMNSNNVINFDFVSNEDEEYYTYKVLNSSLISRLVLNQSMIQRYVWNDYEESWILYWSMPRDQCDPYAKCGPNGVCNSNGSPVCDCLRGFEPRSPEDWNLRDASGGCGRRTPLQCQNQDGFLKMSGLKLPDTSEATTHESLNLEECRLKCLRNCSCMAYSSANFMGRGSGCITWGGDLIDLKKFDENGQDLYIRLAASELGNSKRKQVIIIVIMIITSVALLSGFIGCCILKKNCRRKDDENGRGKELELPLFDNSTIAFATDNFADANKLGEGGFGTVYKGRLGGGQLIAVKRLSKNSSQGLEEFKNEVTLIVKLQHVNLVRLLGCCIQGEEKMLIYEYMDNRSLDTFIFDNTKSKLLSWEKRFNIITGIARGLLYLHQDSRFKIIHRDLKVNNILLDKDMNPKISDFGLARIFGGDGKEEHTKRPVGTYGYMAPEYAMDGIFSVKSDVFSFGVVLLKIISGKKNIGFYYSEHQQSLLSYAWNLWKEENSWELVDESISNPDSYPEVLRCLQVGLLCVQESARDRPEMSEVLLMLSAQSLLPKPKPPGFSTSISPNIDTKSSSSYTANDLTITTTEGR